MSVCLMMKRFLVFIFILLFLLFDVGGLEVFRRGDLHSKFACCTEMCEVLKAESVCIMTAGLSE